MQVSRAAKTVESKWSNRTGTVETRELGHPLQYFGHRAIKGHLQAR